MKLVKIVLWIVALLILTVTVIFAYYGGFTSVTPEIKNGGGEILVYEKVMGDYGQSAEVSNRVYQKLLDDYRIETTKGFGVYYDNPKTTEKDKLRADVGCILESDFGDVEVLKKDFEIRHYPEGEYMIAEFPYKGMPSVLIGIMKVYPKLNAYAQEKGYAIDSPVMEIWDVPNKKISYRKELIKIES